MNKKRKISLFIISLIFIINIFSVRISAENDYPYRNCCKGKHSDDVSPYGSYYRQCTDFVSWRLNSRNGIPFTCYYGGISWGNASNWGNAAKQLGIPVNSTPAIGAVAWFKAGHVAWVEDVDGKYVTIEEYNADYGGCNYSRRTIKSSTVSGFIHLKDIKYSIDISGTLDSQPYKDTKEFATFDIIINGKKVADNVCSYHGEFAPKTEYSITDIKPVGCSKYLNSIGKLSGKLTSDQSVTLSFKTEHSYKVTSITDPTCVKDGEKIFTCSVCKTSKVEILHAFGHSLILDKSTVEDSFTGNLICSTCSTIIEQSTEIPSGALKGDTNNDGIISVIDAKQILQNITKAKELSVLNYYLADINDDGKVSIIDAKKVIISISVSVR